MKCKKTRNSKPFRQNHVGLLYKIGIMKFYFFLLASISLLAISCNKNSYTTKPQISIESITTVVPLNGEFDAKLKYTDKQGDLGNGIFNAVRISLNQQPPTDSLASEFSSPIPNFNNKSLGELEFTLPPGSLSEHTTQNDTLQFQFSVTDRAGNTSDTITSPVIVVLYQ
jgi:hypothetical protein